MAAVDTYTKTGNKATTAAKLDAAVFGIKVENHDLLRAVYDAYLANGRLGNASTKTRGLVSGGGRKPWRQKGTGRARFGSSRNPIWRGGGIAFGPTGEQNYVQKVNAKAKRQAIRQALSLLAGDKRIKVIESLNGSAKTKDVAKVFEKLNATKKVICVVEMKDDSKLKGTHNLPGVKVVGPSGLNVFDLLNADSVIIEQKALGHLTKWLGEK